LCRFLFSDLDGFVTDGISMMSYKLKGVTTNEKLFKNIADYGSDSIGIFRNRCFIHKNNTENESDIGYRLMDFSGRVSDCSDCGSYFGDFVGEELEAEVDLHFLMPTNYVGPILVGGFFLYISWAFKQIFGI